MSLTEVETSAHFAGQNISISLPSLDFHFISPFPLLDLVDGSFTSELLGLDSEPLLNFLLVSWST